MSFHLAWLAAVAQQESVDILQLPKEGHQARLSKGRLIPLVAALEIFLGSRATLQQVKKSLDYISPLQKHLNWKIVQICVLQFLT